MNRRDFEPIGIDGDGGIKEEEREVCFALVSLDEISPYFTFYFY